MGYRKKQEEIPIEDAIEMAKDDLQKYWFGAIPMIAALELNGKRAVYPLDPEFNKKVWLLYFIDPTSFTGENCIFYASEWYERYHQLGIESLLIFRPNYKFLTQKESLDWLAKKYQFSFPIVLDYDSSLSKAFGAESLPSAILLHDNEIIIRESGDTWFEGTEVQIQSYLRSKDPGLPLFPAFQPARKLESDSLKLEMGHGKGVEMVGGKFHPPQKGLSTGVFEKTDSDLEAGKIYLTGNWMQDDECIATKDPEATLTFLCPYHGISMICQSLSKIIESAKITIELDGQPAYDSYSAADLEYDEGGNSVLRVKSPQFYHALTNLPDEPQPITLRFTNANRVPTAILGMRFQGAYALPEKT